ALADYNRARAKGNFDQAKDAETKKLEEDLNRAQGSNLIMAQNEFSLNNSRQGPGGSPLPSDGRGVRGESSGGQIIQYDKAAAEAQWAKLQQAQELGIAKVQPIHVNLPTRGLRHAFTQVLQTETNKPMVIRLMAVNDKVVSWPKRIGAAAAGFVGLWLGVSLLAKRFPRKQLPATAPA